MYKRTIGRAEQHNREEEDDEDRIEGRLGRTCVGERDGGTGQEDGVLGDPPTPDDRGNPERGDKTSLLESEPASIQQGDGGQAAERGDDHEGQ